MLSARHRDVLTSRVSLHYERLEALGQRIRDWVRTGTDYYMAAARYEELASLANVELACLGFSRSTLARDLIRACERSSVYPGRPTRTLGENRHASSPRNQ